MKFIVLVGIRKNTFMSARKVHLTHFGRNTSRNLASEDPQHILSYILFQLPASFKCIL